MIKFVNDEKARRIIESKYIAPMSNTKAVVLKVIGAAFLLPGFLFDVCLGLAFIMNDGRSDGHRGDWLGEWAFSRYHQLPDFWKVPMYISMIISALPAGVFCIGLVLATVFGMVYVMNGILGSVLSIPFTGKIQWRTLTSFTD